MEGALGIFYWEEFCDQGKPRSKSLFFTGICVLGCFRLQVTESLIEASLSKLITNY